MNEIACAALIASAPTRSFGLVLGAAVLAAVLVTVLRHGDYGHLPPIGHLGRCWDWPLPFNDPAFGMAD